MHSFQDWPGNQTNFGLWARGPRFNHIFGESTWSRSATWNHKGTITPANSSRYWQSGKETVTWTNQNKSVLLFNAQIQCKSWSYCAWVILVFINMVFYNILILIFLLFYQNIIICSASKVTFLFCWCLELTPALHPHSIMLTVMDKTRYFHTHY